jgi:hypothetical protein
MQVGIDGERRTVWRDGIAVPVQQLQREPVTEVGLDIPRREHGEGMSDDLRLGGALPGNQLMDHPVERIGIGWEQV